MTTDQSVATTDRATAENPYGAGRPRPAAGAEEPPTATPRRTGPLGRIASLAVAELKVLRRNSVAAFYAIAMAPAMLLLMTTLPVWEDIASVAGPSMSVRALGMLAIFGIVMAIYFNLTTAAVARRESLALKRQVSGTARPWEVLTALAIPNTAVFLAQVVIAFAVVATRMEMPALTNPLVAVVGVLLGAIVFALLAYVTTIVTRTAESAQLTTMPMMLVGLVISGALVPMSVLPDTAATVLELLPVMPITELVTIGLGGTSLAGQELSLMETFTHAARPAAVLAIWIAVLAVVVSKKMPFEPRR
ncbi:ABC transporter permease [Georgenia sp. Z1344]|uniref:ABC transporter permease n=1 Tax=Georgenia sp. Z1344 TaxID=3416706 RepID=UPI003CEFE7BF